MILLKIKNKLNKIWTSVFFHKEPDWYWGLFCILFSLIVMRYIIHRGTAVYNQVYYSLPLFEFFHIPSPASVKNFIEQSLSLSISIPALFSYVKIVFVTSLILASFGLLFQRFFTVMAFLSFFISQGWYYGYIRTADNPKVYHSANIVFFILLVWMIAPPNTAWTVKFWIKRFFLKWKKFIEPQQPINRLYPTWPRALIILTISLTFFGSFFQKYKIAGFAWIDGYTLQAYLLDASLLWPNSHAGWLASQNFYIIWFLSIGVWMFQSTAPIGFLWKKTRLLYGITGVLFHTGVFLFLGFSWRPFQYMYVIFIPELYQFLSKNIRFKRTHKNFS